MRSGEEIQQALTALAGRWTGFAGTERGEAQTFLNELIECYGGNRRDQGAVFEDAHTSDGIMDMYWRDRCIVEMKAPKEAERLAWHRPQAMDYWRHSDDAASGRSAPPYVVLCAFHRFEVWEPGRFPSDPRASFSLAELPEHYEALLFLAGDAQESLFHAQRKALTTEATKAVVGLYQALRARQAAAPDTMRDFVLQVVWVLFAESLGMIPGRPLETIVEQLLANPGLSSAAVLGELFRVLNDREPYSRVGNLADIPYVNGGLFREPAAVNLNADELAMLVAAADFDWRAVEPTIFGSLMEGCLGRDLRWELGAHYTHETDIMKIVRPSIVEPWRGQIEAATTVGEAVDVLSRLCEVRVLDPACGCGNFLYVAYRELRGLEQQAKSRVRDLARAGGEQMPAAPLPSYPIRNVQGLEIDEFAVRIARVTLWMGHKLGTDLYGLVEPVLPLVDLSNIRTADALDTAWPVADVIIGNPPFQGSQWIRQAHGGAYVDWLKKAFGCGVKDYCVYWFRKTQDALPVGGRAGLVGTNSISQNRARSASLDYVVAGGGVITEAVSTQKWAGDANVHVSLVNWIKRPAAPPDRFVLDGAKVSGITAELRTPERSTGVVAKLPQNAGVCFQGPIPVGDGFILSADEALALRARTDADYTRVVRPYLTGDDIAEDPLQGPRRWIIDFAVMPLEEAMRYPAALDIVRGRVKPVRDKNRDAGFRRYWWRFGRPRPEQRSRLGVLDRWAAGTRVGKRLLLAWQPPEVSPSDATNAYALMGDDAMGVVLSGIHDCWAWSRASTLKGDLRYTPTTVFETFPWPDMTDEQRERIGAASRRVIAIRQEICVREDFGLTKLYNAVDEGAYADVRDAHRELDDAVAEAYGWPRAVARDDDEIVRHLLALNREIVAGTRPYDPFGRGAGQAMLGAP